MYVYVHRISSQDIDYKEKNSNFTVGNQADTFLTKRAKLNYQQEGKSTLQGDNMNWNTNSITLVA